MTGTSDGRPAAVLAVVPLRGGGSGKSRLAHVLEPADRSALVVAMARHVVATLAVADDVVEVLVVTADPAFARRALDGVPGPVRVLEQPASARGLNAAAGLGREAAAVAGVRLAVVHADLPGLTPGDVTALLGAPAPLVLAADRLGTGTNALVLDRPAHAFRSRFGPGSLAAHRAEAAGHGWDAVVVRRPGAAVDLDTRADWAALPAGVRRRLTREVPALVALDGADAGRSGHGPQAGPDPRPDAVPDRPEVPDRPALPDPPARPGLPGPAGAGERSG